VRRRGVRRLPVLNATGGLAGIVTTDDIFAALSTQLGGLSNALSREQVREMEIRN
jgi:CBS domain-containing protein